MLADRAPGLNRGLDLVNNGSSEARLLKKEILGSSLEALIEIGGQAYPIVWMPSYGSSIINPNPEEVVAYANGRVPEVNSDSPMALLVPLQANGRCGADCKGCVFANRRVGNALETSGRALAYPTDPEVMTQIIKAAKYIALESDLVSEGQSFRVNPLLSGDPSFNRHTHELIQVIARNPDIAASRWSTIAVSTEVDPLATFIDAALLVRERVPAHKLRFQVSLQSTDPEVREKHVGHYRGGVFPNLEPMDRIAGTFDAIKNITGYSSTLSFVIHQDSVIDPAVIEEHFSADSTWVSLRPMIPTNGENAGPIDSGKLLRLYLGLREKGFTVVMMPTINGMEQDNLKTGQLHRGREED